MDAKPRHLRCPRPSLAFRATILAPPYSLCPTGDTLALAMYTPAPTPANERQRMAELVALEILDTPPEERFDRIVRLAKAIFRVPIAYIALVDRNRQWFKSKEGLA